MIVRAEVERAAPCYVGVGGRGQAWDRGRREQGTDKGAAREARPGLGGRVPEARWKPLVSLPSFPSEHFGKLFGLVMALSAIVSLLQFPIFMLIGGPLQNDPLYVSAVPRGGEGSPRPAFPHRGRPDRADSAGPQQRAPPNLAVP